MSMAFFLFVLFFTWMMDIGIAIANKQTHTEGHIRTCSLHQNSSSSFSINADNAKGIHIKAMQVIICIPSLCSSPSSMQSIQERTHNIEQVIAHGRVLITDFKCECIVKSTRWIPFWTTLFWISPMKPKVGHNFLLSRYHSICKKRGFLKILWSPAT